MTDRYQPFIVTDAMTGEELEGIPTPALIEARLTNGMLGFKWKDAYAEHYPSGTIWRLKDTSYDPPGTEYRRVWIKRNERMQYVEPTF